MSRKGARQPFRRPRIHLLRIRKMRPGHCRATDTAGDDCAACIQTLRRSSTQTRVEPGVVQTPPFSHINRALWLLFMGIWSQVGSILDGFRSCLPCTGDQGFPASPKRSLLKQSSSVGYLCRSLPFYVQKPPIEAVVFGWGVNEDGQLVSTCLDIISKHATSCLAVWLAFCSQSTEIIQSTGLMMVSKTVSGKRLMAWAIWL